MPNAKDVTVETEYLKVLVLGDSGTGKSIFASSFPTPGYVYNFDKSMLSYRGLDFDYDDFDNSPEGWVKFEKVHKELYEKMTGDNPPYKTVIVDSTTTWSSLAMERALQLDPKRSPTKGPVWNVHYGMVRNLVEGRLRQMLDFKSNLVVIGHLQVKEDQETGAIMVVPMLTGQLAVTAPGLFDEVYYTRTKKGAHGLEWLIQTVAIGRGRGRSRLSGKGRILPDEMPNDYAEIVKILSKEVKR